MNSALFTCWMLLFGRAAIPGNLFLQESNYEVFTAEGRGNLLLRECLAPASQPDLGSALMGNDAPPNVPMACDPGSCPRRMKR